MKHNAADTEDRPQTCSGFCARCQTVHSLGSGKAKYAALELIARLDREKRLDFNLPPDKADPRYCTRYLFGKARGKMFGAMVCRRADGSELTVKAFSGQYNGSWALDGWAPPVFDLYQWHLVNDGVEKEIKNIGRQFNALDPNSDRAKDLSAKRAQLSRTLMKALHRLYTLHNFRSQSRPLAKAFLGDNGLPNGTADCCGPKLLNYAARNNLQPVGLAEFYYGRSNRQGTRHHGRFYPSCREKCQPILGFMLCGLKGRTM